MNTDLWNSCIEYHGHTCGGIALGYMAAMYAKELLEIKADDDIHQRHRAVTSFDL